MLPLQDPASSLMQFVQHQSQDVANPVQNDLWSCDLPVCLSAYLFQQGCTVADFLSKNEPNACGGFIRNCFSLRSRILND